MSGAKYSVFACGTCRNKNNYSIFKLPTDQVQKWRNDLLHVISRDRAVDANFKRLISSEKYIFMRSTLVKVKYILVSMLNYYSFCTSCIIFSWHV